MDPRLRIHGEHHGEGGKHVPSTCPSAKTERERGGKRGEAVGKEAAQGAGAASWCWLRRRRGGGARSGERTRGGSAERGRSPKGSRGSEITVVVRSPVKRLLTWASVPARPSARRATCGSKVSGSTRSCRISVRPSVIRFSSSESRLVPPVLPDCSFRLWVRARSLCTEGGGGGGKKVDRIGERRRRIEPRYCGWLIRSLASSEESGIDKVTWYRGFSLFLSRSSRLLVSRAYSRGVRFGISDRCQWSTPVNKRAPFDAHVFEIEDQKWGYHVLSGRNYVSTPSESGNYPGSSVFFDVYAKTVSFRVSSWKSVGERGRKIRSR